jgi:polyhydroxyalkanoate synthesis regulator phasin
MSDKTESIFSRAALFAMGAAYSTAEGIKSMVDGMVKQGEVSGNEASKLVDNLVARGKDAKARLDQSIAEAVTAYLKNAGLPTRAEFDKLDERVKALESGKTG